MRAPTQLRKTMIMSITLTASDTSILSRVNADVIIMSDIKYAN